MPIYGYTCQNCGHTLDALQKMADDPLVDCPECGQPALKRQLSAPRFRLKGQGWYETDFKQDNQRNLAGDKDDKPASDKGDKSEKGDKGKKGGESGKGETKGGKKDTAAKSDKPKSGGKASAA